MVVLNFKIIEQRIVRKNNKYLVNYSQGYLYLSFTFNETWASLKKYIIFKFKDKNYLFELEYDNESKGYLILVPSEVLKGKAFKFNIYGTMEEDTIFITTKDMTVRLNETGFTTDITTISNEPTDIVSTIIEKLGNKFDDLVFEEDNVICKSGGDVVKIIPLSFLEDYYTKSELYTQEETDDLLDGKADLIHNHITDDVTDFDDAVDLDLSNVLGTIAENIRRI